MPSATNTIGYGAHHSKETFAVYVLFWAVLKPTLFQAPATQPV